MVDIDPGMVKLVKALHLVPAIGTLACCEGQENPEAGQQPSGRWSVSIEVDEIRAGWALALLADVAMEFGDGCILQEWSNDGVLSWSLDGVTEACSPDAFAAALLKGLS
jgi:hypothetical protein